VSILCLSFHAGYRCRHSGACCTSGWTIPVEPPLRRRLDAALAAGTLRLSQAGGSGAATTPGSPFVDGDTLPDGSSVLRVTPGGACTCYDASARRCRIHSQLGHDALPAACQHFPRVCLIDRNGASVTLSHYCPTAARLLVEPAKLELCAAHDIDVLEAPPGFAPMPLEGLDARDELPALLRPRMLADRQSYWRWERLVLQALQGESTPEAALSVIVEATEALRAWEPDEGPLIEAVARAFDRAAAADRSGMMSGLASSRTPALARAEVSLDRLVRESVPPGLSAPPAPGDITPVYAGLVAPRWTEFAAPVRRYLAAKAFANWCAYQGRGLRTVVCSLAAALSVLRVEAARHCESAGRALDEALLVEAFRSADLLLVHLASREELARRLSDIEDAGPGDLREAIATA
jgi:Fe-S-cluster containining protein